MCTDSAAQELVLKAEDDEDDLAAEYDEVWNASSLSSLEEELRVACRLMAALSDEGDYGSAEVSAKSCAATEEADPLETTFRLDDIETWSTASSTLDWEDEDPFGMMMSFQDSEVLGPVRCLAAEAVEQQPLMRMRSAMVTAPPSGEAGAGTFEVLVHIYDVSKEPAIRRVNAMLAHPRSKFKLGGAFHVGVEVRGREWSFGHASRGTGVRNTQPRKHRSHHYRETIRLGRTPLTAEEIEAVLTALQAEYPGESYDLIHRNCLHFANDFCKALDVGVLPNWVCRLAKLGEKIDAALHLSRR